MDFAVLQNWLDQLEDIKRSIEDVENLIESTEITVSENTGTEIAYDFDLQDLSDGVQEAFEKLNSLKIDVENFSSD